MTTENQTTELTDEQKAEVIERNRAAAKAKSRAETLQGLREVVEFFERNPEFPVPVGYFNVYPEKAAEFVELRRTLGVRDKYECGDSIYVTRKFAGGVTLDINISKAKTCKQVPTGKKIVIPAEPAKPEREVDEMKWECGSVLAAADAEDSGESDGGN